MGVPQAQTSEPETYTWPMWLLPAWHQTPQLFAVCQPKQPTPQDAAATALTSVPAVLQALAASRADAAV